MTDDPKQPEELGDKELEEQDGEPLPDREAMSVISPLGDPSDFEIGSPPPTD